MKYIPEDPEDVGRGDSAYSGENLMQPPCSQVLEGYGLSETAAGGLPLMGLPSAGGMVWDFIVTPTPKDYQAQTFQLSSIQA